MQSLYSIMKHFLQQLESSRDRPRRSLVFVKDKLWQLRDLKPESLWAYGKTNLSTTTRVWQNTMIRRLMLPYGDKCRKSSEIALCWVILSRSDLKQTIITSWSSSYHAPKACWFYAKQRKYFWSFGFTSQSKCVQIWSCLIAQNGSRSQVVKRNVPTSD